MRNCIDTSGTETTTEVVTEQDVNCEKLLLSGFY